ncbi:TPA: TnsD family Tn7-like transposition protein [Citrobacter werkmanii]
MLWLPKAFPDELLISRLIRFVTLFGWSGLGEIYGLLGSHKRSIHPTMTGSLTVIISKNIDVSNLVLMQQTLAPLFAYCLPNHRDVIINSLISGDSSRALRGCQFPSFGTESSLILKNCPKCAEEDIRAYGVSYWHRMHQIPGVSVCAIHRNILIKNICSQRQRLVAGYLPKPSIVCEQASEEDFRLALFSNDFLQMLSNNKMCYPAVLLYRKKLYMEGFITNHGRLRHSKLMNSFYDSIWHSNYTENSYVPLCKNDYGYLYHLLNSEFSTHPGRHLLFTCWLFKSVSDIQDCIQAELEDDSELKKTNKNIVSPEIDFSQIISRNMSMNKMSKVCGRSRCFIKRNAAIKGVKLETLPRKITEELRKKIESLAALGFHRKVIAERCQICVGSVENIISSCGGLVMRRKLCHYQSFLRRSKCKILKCRRLYPELTRTGIMKKYSADFYWLYNHEKTLLYSILPPALHPEGCKKLKTNRGDHE